MKKIIFILIILSIALNLNFAYAIVDAMPNTSAKAAIVMDVNTGRVLYEKNIYEKLPMASTTKIMTTILALENSNLDDIVKVSYKASNVGGSSIYLKPGEKIKMEDLLYGVMLESGNDAATAVAEYIGGSVEKFAEMMNKKAYMIGAYNTHFVNPHGLDRGIEDHYTTAYDLAKITAYGLKNPVFCKIVSTKTKIVPWEGTSWNRVFKNHNKMLWQYPYVNGVKTGFTNKAGRCLVTSANKNNMQLVVVTLNDPNDWKDTADLLDYGFNNFKYETIIKQDDKICKIPVYNGKGKIINLISAQDYSIPLKSDNTEKTSLFLMVPNYVYAPIKKGDLIGYAYVLVNDKKVALIDLFSDREIKPKNNRFFIFR